ncbi:uncharacterized protein LOC131440258 [Malaya genurostris]|uniref:uncharacterized protein LOC131440258 n=1 Tax=Malaya genurostris TaxID=325434 RepID=UPI0026F4078B|nr:uncharacterized protein LOC131440258 [Malaya genurostris]
MIIFLQINKERRLTNASCTCVTRKLAKCKHIYALIYYVNANRSETKTSLEQEWGLPSARRLGNILYAKPIPISTLFPRKKGGFVDSPIIPLTEQKVKNLVGPLRDTIIKNFEISKSVNNNSNSARRMKRPDNDLEGVKCCIWELINMFTEGNCYGKLNIDFPSPDLKQYYESSVVLRSDQIFELCVSTRTQADGNATSLWFAARKLRISASEKAHKIKVRTSRKPAHNLAKDLINSKTVDHPNLMYGSQNEKIALNLYRKQNNNYIIFEIGVLVSEYEPWLCASLDGVVIGKESGLVEKVLEIKCPINCKDQSIFDERRMSFGVKYLDIVDNEIYLRKNHQYYTQVQLQMYISNTWICDLFLYSPKGNLNVEVRRDDEFLSVLIPKLQNFYVQYYLPALYKDTHKYK